MELELRGVTKRFPGGVVANDAVDLLIRGGEILGLVGENGAGKSTLMNILYGLYAADEGEVLLDGDPLVVASPADAIAAGIGMVHQHFMLVPVFTVAENVILGVEPVGRFGRIKIEEARQRVRDVSEQYGLELDPDARIEDLPVGIQQRVEIMKVLFRDATLLVFDEPTAVLTPQEVEEFFGIIDMLKDSGHAIVFITHKLKEALRVSDRIAVLRRGKIVGEASPGEVSELELAEMMVGRPVQLVVDKGAAEPGEAVLDVGHLVIVDEQRQPRVTDVSFQVHAGEIVGIAGVQGNGQTELVEGLFGLQPIAGGNILVGGEDMTGASARMMHRAGVAHIPENRQARGLVLDFSVTENAMLDAYYDEPFSRGLRLDHQAARRRCRSLVEEFDVRTPSIDVPASTLSGGNQQKLIVGREMGRDVDLTVAAQPTRGVDVGSIEYIHERLIAERDSGGAILLVSTELDEVMALSDRILVMFRGQVIAERRPEDTSTGELGLLMAGIVDEQTAPVEVTS